MNVDPRQLINSSGIAARYGVSRAAVSWWRTHMDFPAPLSTPLISNVPLWDVVTVEAWTRNHNIEMKGSK